MSTVDNGGNDDGDRLGKKNDIAPIGTPKSPWNTSVAASPVMRADSESWPALSDARQRIKNDGSVDSKNSTELHSRPLKVDPAHGCGASPAAPPSVGAFSL